MVTEFFVRIFIYGLGGFVLGDGQTTVLLPTADGHQAFVAFENRACSPKPCLPPGDFQRLALAGDQIDIPQLASSANPPGHRRQGRSQMADSLKGTFDLTLPLFDSDSIAVDWLPRMDSLGNSGTVDPDCMAGASANTCNRASGGLKGRLVLASGVLSTCHLIETSTAAPNCNGQVHTFTFSQVSPLVEQALADIEVDVTKVTAADLTLTLTQLGADHARQTIKLLPVPCFDNPSASCVDIFVANMPPPSSPRTTDCSVQKQGDHFATLYPLLAPGFQGSTPIPIQDLDHFKVAADVQPACRQVPLAGVATTIKQFQALAEVPHLQRVTDKDRDLERNFDAYLFRAFNFDHHYPYQRPICPMAAFNPPASQ